MSTDLTSLLAAGERAAFHGPPGSAVGLLESAATLAAEQGREAEASAIGWLLGVALAAAGRVGSALAVLQPLWAAAEIGGPEARLFGALAAATAASAHRQLGRHPAARELDLTALELSGSSAEALFDARIGLAADFVGLEDADGAAEHLRSAADLVLVREEWWRQRVRLDWGRAELALFQGDPETAAAAAAAAVERAEAARAPRHVAKSLLYAGLAQIPVRPEDAAGTLRRAATLAESLGALPLVWRARALLGAIVAQADAQESARSLSAARSAVHAIAADLPPELRRDWLARVEIAALLAE